MTTQEHVAEEGGAVGVERDSSWRTRRTFALTGTAALTGAIVYGGVDRFLGRKEAPAEIIGGGDQGLPNAGLAIEATPGAVEVAVDDVATTNPTLAHVEGVYDEGETTPETFFEAYDEADPMQVRLRELYQLPDELLEGLEGTHAKYIDEVMRILGDVTKIGRTEEEIMEFTNPEFFADTAGMNSDQIAIHNSAINSAIESYVVAQVDKYADAIYETIVMPEVGYNKHEITGYSIVVKLLEVSLREFAEHVRKYKNTAWKMTFTSENSVEDVRGKTVFVKADIAISINGWSSNGDMASDYNTENAKIFFAGRPERWGLVGTGFMAEYSDEYKSFMDALEKIRQS